MEFYQSLLTEKDISIFTWHDANQGSYAKDCILRTDGNYKLTSESGHVAGFRTKAPPSFDDFDCKMRQLAMDFAAKLQPWRGKAKL